jgi:putative spermidine/putrescine transport system substrate-binding protein
MIADKPAELVIMSWAGGWGRALREAVCEPFRAETGIVVRQAYHVGLQLPLPLTAALQAGARAPIDVIWCNAVAALRAHAAGYCDALGEVDGEVDGLERLAARARPAGAARAGVVFPYVVYYVLVYARALHSQPPRSWSVLCDPRHRGGVGLYPGGNGLFPIAQVMGGGRVTDIPHAMDACWRFVRRLAPQVGELDYSIGMERLLAAGHLTVCLRALTNALAFRDAGLDVDFAVPEEGTSDTLDALWVPRGLPAARAFWARRLVSFCLRAEVQERLCERLGCMPVHPDARPPALLLNHPRLPNAADDVEPLLYIPDTLKLEHLEVWEERFERELARSRRCRRACEDGNEGMAG